jgi:hypothetical protein
MELLIPHNVIGDVEKTSKGLSIRLDGIRWTNEQSEAFENMATIFAFKGRAREELEEAISNLALFEFLRNCIVK